MSECGAQLAQNPSTHNANLPRKLTRKDFLPISSTSRSKNRRPRAFAYDLQARVTKFQNKPLCVRLPRWIPFHARRGRYFLDFIQTLYYLGILSRSPVSHWRLAATFSAEGELCWARHLKVNFDLGRPPQRKYFGVSGAISFKLPLDIHEQLTEFASIVQREMWNQGNADSFYPADVRNREHFITATGSTSI